MKNIYLPLVVGIGLAFAANNSYAKFGHPTTKKSAHFSSKHVKTTAKITLNPRKKIHLRAVSSSRHHFILPSPGHKTDPSLITAHENARTTFENRDQPDIQPSTTNHRVHSLIEPHNNNINGDYSGETVNRHFISTHGIVNFSLTMAAQNAGLSNDLLLQLTNIFAWDIDFATSLRDGDQFTVVYEKMGSANDQIIAAEFVTNGKTFTAIRYKDNDGEVNYYSPEGKLMRKSFLSAPLDFVRISSSYSTHRKHPVLNRIRAHKGIDYAARTGTPVKASGDGEIAFLGRKGGYGQVIVIKHGEHYETLYAHLSDYKKGLETGNQVRQGEVIGYVGQTGLATGPHLHYEFRVDGEHRNPESLNRQHSLPLSDDRLADFKSESQPLLAQLYQTKARSLLAKSGSFQ